MPNRLLKNAAGWNAGIRERRYSPMSGRPNPQRSLLAIVDLEERLPRNHSLRWIKAVSDVALARLSPAFDHMYAPVWGAPPCRPTGCWGPR